MRDFGPVIGGADLGRRSADPVAPDDGASDGASDGANDGVEAFAAAPSATSGGYG